MPWSKSIMDDKLTCLSYWYPRLETAGLPVPRTTILHAPDLISLLDGETPAGWHDFLQQVKDACLKHELPCFLRTGYGSGKHYWDKTCFVADVEKVDSHIYELVEWSEIADFAGLPHDIFAIRTLIPTRPVFKAFHGFPVTREFRVFIRDEVIEHTQPYWPPAAIEDHNPDKENWRELLYWISKLADHEKQELHWFAIRACRAVGGGYWSVDLLEDKDGDWWITDLAIGKRSFKWDSQSVQ